MSVINLIRSKHLLVGIVALGFVGVSCTDDSTTGLGDGDETGTLPSLTEMAIVALEEALFAAITGLDNVGGLDQFSFESARALFEQALQVDPTNETAALGLAMTTIFVLEDDPDLRAAADDWEVWLENHELDDLTSVLALSAAAPLFWKRASLPFDLAGGSVRGATHVDDMVSILLPAPAGDGDYPPTPEEHQGLLRDVVAPALQAALVALNTVDAPDFVFSITERMQGENPGEADVLELDLTEIFALRAALEVALATTDLALAYVVTPTPYGADGFATAMEPGSTFGTLATQGGTLLADAHERLLRAVDLVGNGLDFLESETDSQDDDIIKRDPIDGLSSQDIQDARDVLADVQATLQGPRDVTEDFGNGEVTVTFDVSRFFLNPITDLKAMLPDYEVVDGRFRWTALNFNDWTFPDPSFNGILPGASSTSDLTSALDLEDIFSEIGTPLTGYYDLLTIDGVDCAMAQLGCPVDNFNVLYSNLDIMVTAYLYLNIGQDTDSDGVLDFFDFRLYNGTYTAVYGSGNTIDVQFDLVDDFGNAVTINATMTDQRSTNGGFPITFTFLSGVWVMEKDRGPVPPLPPPLPSPPPPSPAPGNER